MQDIYSATFIFQKKEYDDEFYALDNMIAEFAKKTEGYLGDESYAHPESGQLINIYYWKGRDGLDTLIHNSTHQEAKQKHAKWLNGYQVIIAKIEAAYNDGKLEHPLKNIAIQHKRSK
ncbi:antibiotic biosynthesis monooxygenase family protein [Plesiomonas sp.]|uniref:antibiotic biosynthesis monooxygenase family protein n=1 Tax=Plesiomonas sp. TaxID=2486279 RepID=UPI003F2CD991